MNKLDLAEALIAIADCGAIHKAALKLNQTSAAISKKLTKLEAALSTQLINRDRKGLILTEAGQRYYHEAKKALAQFALAEQCIAETNIQPRGELKIVSNEYYAKNFILPQLPQFLTKYPLLSINLDIAEILPDFNAKKMDILYGVSTSGDDNLVRKRIDTTRYILCASPTYLKRSGAPKSSAELLQHDFIAHGARKLSNTIVLDKDEHIVMKPKLFLNNTALIIQAALEHLGFIWTHENIVLDLIAKKKLISILDSYTKQSTHIYAYYEQLLYRDPKIAAFMSSF